MCGWGVWWVFGFLFRLERRERLGEIGRVGFGV